ncbi:MAG: hypothetical protein Kow0092_19050 [Deferrisomatales bacterium]
MAYLVLARKWRPQTFEQIRGQDHIVRALRNAIASGRIAHAYVFTGIRGVGKTSAARVLAKALNCVSGPTPTPCNQCPSCREITEGNSPDVLEIDGASNTGVDDVRRLREAVRYPPVRGPYRIYIIDEVHMLSTAAFNALLKTLEEPPPHVVFVFATTDPHKIPVTILSRCQQFDFKRLSPRELAALLAEVARAEGVAIDERSLAALAREADGSVRDAQSLMDQVISYAGERIAYEDTRDVLGVVDRDLLLAVARAVVERRPRGVIEALAEAERFGYDARRFAYDLLDVFRDLSVLAAVDGGEDLVDLAPEEVASVGDLVEGAGWEALHARFDMLGEGVELLRTAARPDAVLEMTLLKMAKLPPLLPLSELLAAARGGQGIDRPTEAGRAREAVRGVPGGGRAKPPQPPPSERPVGKPTPPKARAPQVPAAVGGPAPSEAAGEAAGQPSEGGEAPAPAPPGDATRLWQRLLEGVERLNRPFWAVLREHGSLASWDEARGTAVVRYDDPAHGFFFQEKLGVMAAALREVAGPAARIELELAPGAKPERDAGKETDRARSLKREALEHPLVREAVEIFEGDVEEVRVLKR